MSIKITVPNTGSDYLTFGSGNTPTAAQIGGYDDGSSNGHLEFYTTASGTSTEQMRITSAGNVGIGTGSPVDKLSLYGSPTVYQRWQTSGTGTGSSDGFQIGGGTDVYIWNYGNGIQAFATNNAERMRIDSSGNLLVGTTSALGSYTSKFHVLGTGSANDTGIVIQSPVASGGTYAYMERFLNSSGTQVGYISSSGSATSYATSSDYRLKHDVQPMVGALSKIAALKPVTYKWNADNSSSEGFIAHGLAEVVPDCVTGAKDAVDADGNPVYQGIDTSFLVATLTAAIQEQQAIITTLTERITALENK